MWAPGGGGIFCFCFCIFFLAMISFRFSDSHISEGKGLRKLRSRKVGPDVLCMGAHGKSREGKMKCNLGLRRRNPRACQAPIAWRLTEGI